MVQFMKNFIHVDWIWCDNDNWVIYIFFQLVKLPARITVEDVFGEYLKEKGGNDQNSNELCEGLRDFFNAMLGSQLLYRFERMQYEQVFYIEKLYATAYNLVLFKGNKLICRSVNCFVFFSNLQVIKDLTAQEEKDRKKLSEIYGAPHLLRLFSKLLGI